MVESITKLLLTSSISSDILLSVARQFKELPLIGFYCLVALYEVTELRLLPVDNPLRDVPSTEGSLEICPSDHSSGS
jgi:hypothetical protein